VSLRIPRRQYADLYGPTTGDRVRLADTELFVRVERALAKAGVPQSWRVRRTASLSGGEKQRVAIARALAHRPLLLLADEPTGNLDEVNALEILTLLRKINEMGTTIILATHARELVDKIKKRVVVLESGKLVSDVAQGKYRLEAST